MWGDNVRKKNQRKVFGALGRAKRTKKLSGGIDTRWELEKEIPDDDRSLKKKSETR